MPYLQIYVIQIVEEKVEQGSFNEFQFINLFHFDSFHLLLYTKWYCFHQVIHAEYKPYEDTRLFRMNRYRNDIT